MRSPVNNKSSYYRRWLAGEFGNRPRAWGHIDELEKSSYVGLVNIRSTVAGSTKTTHHVPKSLCRAKLAELGLPIAEAKFNEAMPDESLLIQGELSCDHCGWRLSYSFDKAVMRTAMQNARHVDGIVARVLLGEFCDASSFDDLSALLDEYPDHVIEFSVYRFPVGDCRRNTIVWEVRRY